MQVHIFDIVLLFLVRCLPCFVASRVILAGSKGSEEGLWGSSSQYVSTQPAIRPPWSPMSTKLLVKQLPDSLPEKRGFNIVSKRPAVHHVGQIPQPNRRLFQIHDGPRPEYSVKAPWERFRERLREQQELGELFDVEKLGIHVPMYYDLPDPDAPPGATDAKDAAAAKPKVPVPIAPYGFQVLTDLDDTLFYSGAGTGPGEQTDSFFKNVKNYPGALQFLLELSRGPEENRKPPKIVPLSPRPKGLQDVMKLKAAGSPEKVCQRIGELNGIPSWGIDMQKARMGRIIDSFYGMDSIEFERWAKLYTHLPCVFVGDNSKGDQTSAEMSVATNERVQAAFIFNARGAKEKPFKHRTSDKVFLFDTYYDAAVKATELGYISEAGRKRVEQAFASASRINWPVGKDERSDGYAI